MDKMSCRRMFVPPRRKMLSIRLLLENIIRRILGRGNAKFLVKLVEYSLANLNKKLSLETIKITG